jgi:hypothetical protein
MDIKEESRTLSMKIIPLFDTSYKSTIKRESDKTRLYSAHIFSMSRNQKYFHIEDEFGNKIIENTYLPEDFPICKFKSIGDTFYIPNEVANTEGTVAYGGVPYSFVDNRKNEVLSLDKIGIEWKITEDKKWRKFTLKKGKNLELYPFYIKRKEDGRYNIDEELISKIHSEKDHKKYL